MTADYVTKKDLEIALEKFADRMLKAMHLNITQSEERILGEVKEDNRQYRDENIGQQSCPNH